MRLAGLRFRSCLLTQTAKIARSFAAATLITILSSVLFNTLSPLTLLAKEILLFWTLDSQQCLEQQGFMWTNIVNVF